MKQEKEKFLFKKLDLAFVYIFIFLVGIAIVLFMTSYINNQVEDFSESTIGYSTNIWSKLT